MQISSFVPKITPGVAGSCPSSSCHLGCVSVCTPMRVTPPPHSLPAQALHGSDAPARDGETRTTGQPLPPARCPTHAPPRAQDVPTSAGPGRRVVMGTAAAARPRVAVRELSSARACVGTGGAGTSCADRAADSGRGCSPLFSSRSFGLETTGALN